MSIGSFEVWRRKWARDLRSVSKETDMRKFAEHTDFVLSSLKEDGFVVIPEKQLKRFISRLFTCSNCGTIFAEKEGMVQFSGRNFDCEICYQNWKAANKEAGEG